MKKPLLLLALILNVPFCWADDDGYANSRYSRTSMIAGSSILITTGYGFTLGGMRQTYNAVQQHNPTKAINGLMATSAGIAFVTMGYVSIIANEAIEHGKNNPCGNSTYYQ